jgi:hypothetical protein
LHWLLNLGYRFREFCFSFLYYLLGADYFRTLLEWCWGKGFGLFNELNWLRLFHRLSKWLGLLLLHLLSLFNPT